MKIRLHFNDTEMHIDLALSHIFSNDVDTLEYKKKLSEWTKHGYLTVEFDLEKNTAEIIKPAILFE